MKYTLKKTLAFLLTLVMLVNIFPLAAFAGTDEGKAGPVFLPPARSEYTINVNIDAEFSYDKKLYLALKKTVYDDSDEYNKFYYSDYALQELEYTSTKSFSFSASSQTYSRQSPDQNTTEVS